MLCLLITNASKPDYSCRKCGLYSISVAQKSWVTRKSNSLIPIIFLHFRCCLILQNLVLFISQDYDRFKMRYEMPILRGNDKNATNREKHVGSNVAKVFIFLWVCVQIGDGWYVSPVSCCYCGQITSVFPHCFGYLLIWGSRCSSMLIFCIVKGYSVIYIWVARPQMGEVSPFLMLVILVPLIYCLASSHNSVRYIPTSAMALFLLLLFR